MIKGWQSSVLGLMACVGVCADALAAGSVQESWKKIAREARKDLAYSRFEQAATGYQSAIDTIRKASPRSDAVYDLMLCQAETLRQGGKFKESGVLLDQVEQETKGKDLSDPMLLARYWRRRSLLQVSIGETSEAGTSLLNALDVMLTCFPHQSPYMIAALPKLMDQLVVIESWDAVQKLIEKTTMLYSAAPGIEGQLFSMYSRTLSRYVGFSAAYCASGQLAKAQKLLLLLSTVMPERVGLIEQWQVFLNAWFQRSGAQKPEQAKAGIEKILQLYQRSNSDEARVCELQTRSLLMQISLHQPVALNDFIQQTRQIKDPSVPFHSSVARQERLFSAQNRICNLIHDEIVKRFAASTFDSTTLDLINEEVRLTEYPKVSEKIPQEPSAQLREFAAHHMQARQMLAFYNLAKSRPDEAAAAVNSISPIAAIECPRAAELLARLNTRVGLSYRKQGKLEVAQQFFDRAEDFLKRADASPDTAEVRKMLDDAWVLLKEAR